MGRTDELVRRVCGGDDHPLAPALRGWGEGSRPWLAFAETHAPKLRKKARESPPGDGCGDLLAELAVAALLVRDRRFAVVYEPPRPPGERGPDLGVTFRTHTPLHVEVTRLRLRAEAGEAEAAPRLARALCDKLGQLPTGAANLLAVVVPPQSVTATLVPAALRLLGRSPGPGAEAPPGWWAEGVRAFAQGRGRLSAVALCAFTPAGQPVGVSLWLHPQARHPLHPEVARYLATSAPR